MGNEKWESQSLLDLISVFVGLRMFLSPSTPTEEKPYFLTKLLKSSTICSKLKIFCPGQHLPHLFTEKTGTRMILNSGAGNSKP